MPTSSPRKLVYFVATSVDGFIAGPQGQFDFFPMDGDHIRAQAEELPETFPAHVLKMLGVPFRQARFDTVVMGRKTYEPALQAGVRDPYAGLETWVFSRSLKAQAEGSVHVTGEDPLSTVRALKAKPGRDIWLCGGGQLAAQLRAEINELLLKVNPVVAGDGTRLFDSEFHPGALKLRNRRGFESGVTWLSFDV